MLGNMGIQVNDEAQKLITAYNTETKDGNANKPVRSLLVEEIKPEMKNNIIKKRRFKSPK